MRKYLLGLVILGMLGTVSGFPASIYVVDRTATVDDPAEFNIEIQNDFAEQKTFRISSISSPPPTGSWFGYGNSKTIASGETANFSVTITPPETAIQQNYRFDLNIRPINGDQRQKLSDYFTVNAQNDIKIMSTAVDSNGFMPGEKVNSNITVYNTAPSGLNYEITGSLLDMSSTESSAIASGTQRLHSLSFKIPEGTSPGEYSLEMSVVRDGQERQSVAQTVRVMSLENIDFSSSEDDRLFEYSETLYATNNGNAETQVELNKTLPGYMNPLTNFRTPADRVEEASAGTTYYWSFNLQPGETAAVSYKTRYWPPLVVLIVLFAGILVLKRLYTGVTFSKQVRKTDEGIKVHLKVENRSGHRVDELKITDFVPDIASVEEEFPMAKPVIRKTNNGTRLVWEIESMESSEQRVFEYTIKPLVEVEGGVTLPEAELEMDEQRIAETDEVNVEFRPE